MILNMVIFLFIPGGDLSVYASGKSSHSLASGHWVNKCHHYILYHHYHPPENHHNIYCRLVVDTATAIQFAIDIAKGMAFIHRFLLSFILGC